jgi:hypothetical protein
MQVMKCKADQHSTESAAGSVVKQQSVSSQSSSAVGGKHVSRHASLAHEKSLPSDLWKGAPEYAGHASAGAKGAWSSKPGRPLIEEIAPQHGDVDQLHQTGGRHIGITYAAWSSSMAPTSTECTTELADPRWRNQ